MHGVSFKLSLSQGAQTRLLAQLTSSPIPHPPSGLSRASLPALIVSQSTANLTTSPTIDFAAMSKPKLIYFPIRGELWRDGDVGSRLGAAESS